MDVFKDIKRTYAILNHTIWKNHYFKNSIEDKSKEYNYSDSTEHFPWIKIIVNI